MKFFLLLALLALLVMIKIMAAYELDQGMAQSELGVNTTSSLKWKYDSTNKKWYKERPRKYGVSWSTWSYPSGPSYHTWSSFASAEVWPNCECQCNSYIFFDVFGRAHGNCYSTLLGRPWCYTNNLACTDLHWGRHGTWSYEACSTPHPYSHWCHDWYPNRNRPTWP